MTRWALQSDFINTTWKLSKYGVFSGPYSVRIRENTYRKKLRIWTFFTQWRVSATWIYNEKWLFIRSSNFSEESEDEDQALVKREVGTCTLIILLIITNPICKSNTQSQDQIFDLRSYIWPADRIFNPQLTFSCSKSTIEALEAVSSDVVLVFLLLFLNTLFSSVFIVDFEQVNVSWVCTPNRKFNMRMEYSISRLNFRFKLLKVH